MKKSWHLEDAAAIAKASKYTFYKPSDELISRIKVGHIVKLIFRFEYEEQKYSGERMWVIVTKIHHGKFTGILDNDPYYIKDLKHKDVIEFEAKHIIQVHDLEEKEPHFTEQFIHRCFATSKVLYENVKVKFFYRDESLGEVRDGIYDTGWVFQAGDESDEYLENIDNLHHVSLGVLLNKDDSFVHLLDSEVGSAFGWDETRQEYRRVD